MQKGFMSIDESIQMDFDMPAELREYIEGMDKAFENNDEATWDYYHGVIGKFAKNEYNIGHISATQMYAIWERYGAAG